MNPTVMKPTLEQIDRERLMRRLRALEERCATLEKQLADRGEMGQSQREYVYGRLKRVEDRLGVIEEWKAKIVAWLKARNK